MFYVKFSPNLYYEMIKLLQGEIWLGFDKTPTPVNV